MRLTTLVPLDLRPWFNNPGITTDNHRGRGNFDGVGGSYPFENLAHLVGAPLGLSPEIDGTGRPDNIVCDGQEITLTVGVQTHRCVVLGAAEMGSFREPLTLITDGDLRIRLRLGLTDFAAGGAVYGERCCAVGAHYHQLGADVSGLRPRLWRSELALPFVIQCTGLILPINPLMHVFAVILTGP